MEEKIKELKKLGIAYKCALQYDNVPDVDEEIDFILEEIIKYDKEKLISILKVYEGWSPSNIENKVFSIIDKL